MFPLCDGFRLFLLMSIEGLVAHNHRSVGAPLKAITTNVKLHSRHCDLPSWSLLLNIIGQTIINCSNAIPILI